MELRAFAPKMFELHAAGEYEAARKLVVDAQPHLPEEDAETVTFWRICLDARTSRTIEALDQIEAALDRGWWYGAQMLADPDLDSIRNDPRFVAVARQSEQAQAAASREPCEPIVTEPIGDVRGTVIALHANAGRHTHTSRIWAPAGRRGYRTIAVASSQRVTSDRAAWDDLEQAVADVTSQMERAQSPVIIGGRSLGAALALRLAGGIVPAAGIILVAPTIRWELTAPAHPVPTVVPAGEQDRESVREAASRTAEFLRQAGSPVNHQVVAGMGHFYPEDFDSRLGEAIAWIEQQV